LTEWKDATTGRSRFDDPNVLLLNFDTVQTAWAMPAIIPINWNGGKWETFKDAKFNDNGNNENFFVRTGSP